MNTTTTLNSATRIALGTTIAALCFGAAACGSEHERRPGRLDQAGRFAAAVPGLAAGCRAPGRARGPGPAGARGARRRQALGARQRDDRAPARLVPRRHAVQAQGPPGPRSDHLHVHPTECDPQRASLGRLAEVPGHQALTGATRQRSRGARAPWAAASRGPRVSTPSDFYADVSPDRLTDLRGDRTSGPPPKPRRI